MPKKRTPSRNNYKVGYAKPPVATRFKKGKSGNPKGRPKGSENFHTIARRVANELVSVTAADGTEKRMQRREVLIRSIVQRGLKGVGRSEAAALGLFLRIDDEAPNVENFDEAAISRDQALLRDYTRRKAPRKE